MANTEKVVVQVVVQGQKELDNLSRRSDKATKRIGGLTKGVAGMATGILAAAATFQQINRVIGNAIRSFRDFEFQMAKVKAITNASEKDFQKLSNTAQELGRSTFFTAQQVAELQTNFGKLGFSTQEILAAQEATLNLAVATDTDLARAAVVAGGAIRGFALDASETARVTDVMASAFTSSALDIEKFQTSMTKVAPIAASANIEIEAVTAVMGVLSDAGIEASIAGTSLRQIFLKMLNPTSELAKEIGFTVNSTEDFMKAVRSLSDAQLDNLRIQEVVDNRQVAAFQTIRKSAERVEFLTEQFRLSNGAAKDMANTVGDTLEGAFRRLTSAMQGLQIAALGEGGALTNFVNGLANLFNLITDNIAPQETQIEILQRTAQELDENLSILTNYNLSEDARRLLINKINTEYADYLPNLISEKDTLKEIEALQIAANEALMENILLKQMEEELAELAERNAKAIKAQANSFIDLARIKEQSLSTDDAIIKSNEALEKNIEGIGVLNKTITDNFEQDKKEIEEGYKKLAETLGLNFSKIMEQIQKRKEALQNDGTEENTNVINDNTKAKKANLDVDRELLEFQLNQMVAGNLSEQQAADLKRKLIQQEINDIKQLLRTQEGYVIDREAMLQRLTDLELQLSEETAKDKDKRLEEDIVRAALSGQNALQAVKSVIRAHIMEAVAIQIKKIISSVPFPLNLLVGAGAGILVAGLVDKAMGAIPDKFERGGMVYGNSHANGGEKFAVGGRVVELEGGEAVINKRSTAMFRNQLSAMNVAGGGVKFADGGLLNMPSFSQQQFNALNQSSMQSAMQGSRKVVVVESDITDTQNTVNVIESQATF